MPGKIYITRKVPQTLPNILKKAGFIVEMYGHSDRTMPRQEMLKKIKGCVGVITLLTDRVNEEFLKAAGPQLKVVSNYAVGFDNIDLAVCAKYKVKVGNTPCEEVNEAVAEMAMAMILSLSRRLPEADRFVREGKYKIWDPALMVGPSLSGKTLGIVGLGRIGLGLAHRAVDGFGSKLIYSDVKRNLDFEKKHKAKFVTFEKLLKTADFISLHVPLLKSTLHLISTRQFKIMKKGAVLINTARGPVVDELALLKALKSKQIGGAALDVFECEPAIDCIPSDNIKLSDFDNVIMTPHIATATIEAREKMAELAAMNIVQAVKGKKMPSQVVSK